MAFSKPKYSPYLGTQAFMFYDTTANNKSAIKSTDSISSVRPKVPTTKLIYAKAQLNPSVSSRVVTEETFYSTRVNSHEIALRTFNRQSVSILQAIKFNKQESTPKQNYKIRLKSESVVTEPPHINLRLSTSSERKPNRVFRIRGSTLTNPAYPTLFDNLKIDLTQKSQLLKATSLPCVDIEPNFSSSTKILGLERMCFNAPAQGRTDLPLLIIHFEGIIGSCLVAHNKKVKDNNGTDGSNTVKEYFFVKKDTKEELKRLSKNFLIVVIFPSSNNRYKPMIEHFMNKKLQVDGIYYKPDISSIPDVNRMANYILDYSVITTDFKARKTHKKVVILLPLNLHRSIIKEQLLPREKKNEDTKPAIYEKSCFVHFFPKINVDSSSLRVICLPNFLLDDKNEKFTNLSKTRLSHASKIFLQMLKNLGIELKEPEQVLKKTLEIGSASPSTTTPSNKENEVVEEYSQHTPLTQKVTQTGKKMKDEKIALKTLSLSDFIQELERIKQRNSKFRQIEAVKESNNIIKGQSTHTFEVSIIRQKMVEDLAEIQRAKKSANKSTSNGNNKVSIVSVVGSLFNNNAQLFKAYEKADFYSSRKGASIISDLTKCMEKSKGSSTYRPEDSETWNGSVCELKDSVDKAESEFERRSSMPSFLVKEKSTKIKKRVIKTGDKQGFYSQSMRAKMVEEEEEVLALQLIKRLATDIGLYLAD